MANSKNKSFDRRSEDEKAEGYDVKQNDLPEDRFQKDKQVLKPEELGASSSSIPGNAQRVTTSNMQAKSASAIKSKIKVKPEVSVDELKNKQVGGVPIADTVGVLRSAAGASNVSSASDTSKIPYSEGGYRPTTRYGKKRSDDLFEMDNTISEQIAPIVEDALDLSESPESKQGYNGRKQFKQTRGKKNFARTIVNTEGGQSVTYNNRLPQQLLNESSVDMIHTSKLVYTSGQILDSIQDKANYPKVAHSTGVDRPIDKSNYKPTQLNITLTDGKIAAISIDEDRFDVHASPLVQDEANMNWQVDQNNVTHTMIKLQTELGRETTDKWSPLGYVVDQPYEYNMLMHDIEATTGAIMATAYRSAVSSLAYQKNILAKDGINPQKNAIKMIVEGYSGILSNDSSAVLKTSDLQKIVFDKGAYQAGSAAALIDMFDSTGKYRSKADLLALQRSFGLHLSKADNNINPLHCKPNFIKALNKAHLFSTEDGSYNPMLPIWSTRLIKLMSPLSLNTFLVNWKHPSTFTSSDYADSRRNGDTGTYALYQYSYDDIRNKYTTNVFHPIIEGMLMWLLRNEGALVRAYGSNASITIPWEFNMESPNMLSFMLCSAAQYVLYTRNIIFRDILFAGEQEQYIWDDLVGLDKLNPLYSTQLKIGSYTDPLTLGKMDPDTAIREFWGTHFNFADYQSGAGTNVKVQYFAPWYFNEVGTKATWDEIAGFKDEDKAWNMTIPSIRDGVRHEYVDLIKSMSERDIRLCLDRWLDYPYNEQKEMKTVKEGTNTFSNVYAVYSHDLDEDDINDYIKLDTVRYDSNSDGRIVATYQFEDTTNVMNITEKSLYCIPKELGWIDDCYDPYGIVTDIKIIKNGDNYVPSVTGDYIYPWDTYDSCKVYNGMSPLVLTSYRVEADSDTSGAIDRSAALTQVYYNFFACHESLTALPANTTFIQKTGIIPCWSAQNPQVAYPAICGVGTDTPSTTALTNKVVTMSVGIWTMLQRFMMPINRFENCFNHDKDVTPFDPMEVSFYFGVCGTLASDYTQDVLERLDVCDQLGLDYTEDVFAKDSLLLR